VVDYRKRRQTRLFVLHDTKSPHDVRDIAAWMEAGSRKLGLLDIGCHAIVGRDGAITSCRPWDEVGSATPGFNEDAFQVYLEGGFEGQDDFVPEQGVGLAFLFDLACRRYGPLLVRGHCELGRHRHRKDKCPACDMREVRKYLKVDEPKEDPVSLSPQQQIVVDLLAAGRTLTNKIGAGVYGIGDLPKRVSELKAMGYEIETEWDEEKLMGQTVRFKKYRNPKVEPTP
jgi:hypothetical protein